MRYGDRVEFGESAESKRGLLLAWELFVPTEPETFPTLDQPR